MRDRALLGLVRPTILPPLLALVSLCALLVLACGPPAVTNLSGVASSNRLTIQVHGAEFAESLVYEEEGQTFTVGPSAGMRVLAMDATVSNQTAEVAVLVIDKASGSLSDRQNNSFPLRDPRADRRVTAGATAPKYYTPWLWGSFSLRRGFGVRGWLFFEVPEGLQLRDVSSLSWSSLDSLSVPLQPPR